MPKISALPNQTAPALDDELPSNDVSATTTKKMTVATLMSLMYPVGSIYTNASVSTNPNTLLGFGTWAAFGSGRVLVGVDTGQTEFDVLGETGGAKTHTLITAEMPAHTHDVNADVSHTAGSARPSVTDINTQPRTFTTTSTGGGGAHNNLQPYITVYMWKRTA